MRRVVAALLLCGGIACAQSPDVISGGAKAFYSIVKGNVLKAADEMPEANYSFKPTPDIRSFGELVGHIADAQYYFCGTVAGDAPPTTKVEKTKTSKADLTQALQSAFAYCDKVYDGMTDAKASETVKFLGGNQAKVSVLFFNAGHDYEHYGNMVTYMRLKGLVPPSSAPKN